ITVPPHHDITGAIGAALLAIEEDSSKKTNFRGFDLSTRKYSIDTFVCDDCDNQCEIRKVELENEEPLYYGSRCEKYDIKKKSEVIEVPDYFKIRQQYLLKRYIDIDSNKLTRGRVGFPRILHFFEHYPFWRALFESLGFKVINSDISNQEIVESALEKFSAETCFPIKLVYGHIENLINKNVDMIFLPSLTRFTEGDSPEEGSSICLYVQSISSSVKARFNFEDLGVKFIGDPIHLQQHSKVMHKQLRHLSKVLDVSFTEMETAIEKGFKAYNLFRNNLLKTGKEFLDDLKDDEKCLVVVSRPYNGFDRRLSLNIPQKARKMGIKVIHIDFLSLDILTDDLSSMYWLYGRKILSAANIIRNHPNLYGLFLTSFGCGPDSFISHFFRRSMIGKPYLQLELDEHSADAGMITRLEAFMDSLRFYNHKPPITDYSPVKQRFKSDGKILYIPKMCDHAYAVRASFERCGMNAVVMDDPDDQSLYYGKKFTSGKECFPCVVTTGDMIRQINSKGFDSEKAVFFMPGANGPCRFGQYSQLHRVILDELGHKDIPIYSPNSGTSYGDFDLAKTDFRRVAWKGSVFVDCLIKALLKTRPYEVEKGQADLIYKKYLHKVEDVIVEHKSIQELAEEAGNSFNNIPLRFSDKPIIGLVGEIYLRNNSYSNNYLIEKLEALGCEVRIAIFTEWINYTTLTYKLDSINYRRIKGVLGSVIQAFIQHRDEHNISKRFAKYFPIDDEIPIEKVLKNAQPYLPVEVRGEAALSIGKAIDFVGKGASGIVNCMPFNCMPGTIVSSLSSKVAGDLGNVPWLNISYEGLQDTGEETKLEAFVDQVKSNYSLHKKEIIA
ncbi:MAG: CoA activase, partial [candidate division Zixibacteria bacterium]|nr:CoA activase [candidate division Zixibacteria bacterium]